tara:strand:- start:66 stop:563 length:498 start_codon:yes stop_codon:yes gene_type:complete
MGTTITQTSLISTISESISINGVVYGNSISKSFEGNGKVDQRVMEINSAALTDIFDFTTTAPDSAGSGVQSEFTYFRVTNTDNSVGVTLQLYATSTKTAYIKIPAGCSFVLMDNLVDTLSTGEAFTLRDLVKIAVKADGAAEPVVSAYIEYLAVFKGGEPLPDTP